MLNGAADALYEVVLFIVFGVVVGFQVIAENAAKSLVDTCTDFSAELVDEGVGGAARFAVDEFEEHLALGESACLQLLGILVGDVLLGLLNQFGTLLCGKIGACQLKLVEALLAYLGVGQHLLDIADELLILAYLLGSEQHRSRADGDFAQLEKRDGVAIEDGTISHDAVVIGLRQGSGRHERQQAEKQYERNASKHNYQIYKDSFMTK